MPRVFKDYYKILGVSPQADLKTIRTAYRRLARQHHPDLNPSQEATRMMQDINEAYQVLSDPAERGMYDIWAARVRSGPSHSADAQRRNARRAAQDYERQAAARRAAAEQRKREQAQAEQRRKKETAEQRAREQAEAILRRIEEERRKREAAEAEQGAREQQQREQAEEILRRIEEERLKRERAEAAQDDTEEQHQKEDAEAVLRKIEEEQRRRKKARAQHEYVEQMERKRAQESLNRIERERLRREAAERVQTAGRLLWRLMTRLNRSTPNVTGMVILALIGIIALPFVALSVNSANQPPTPTPTNVPQATLYDFSSTAPAPSPDTPTPSPKSVVYFSDCELHYQGSLVTPTPSPYTVLHHPQDKCARIYAIEWSPDGSMLAASFIHSSGGTEYDVVIWDAQSYEPLQTLADHGPVIAWSPDGKELASYTWGVGVTVWDVLAKAEVARIGNMPADGKFVGVWDLAWSPDGSTLAAVHGDWETFNISLTLWNYKLDVSGSGGRSVQMVKPYYPMGADWSPDGSTLAVCGQSKLPQKGVIVLLDGKTGELQKTAEYQEPLHITKWSPDGHTVACATESEFVLVDARMPQDPFLALSPRTSSVFIEDIAWSPDGSLLAVLGQDYIEIWDVLGCQSESCEPAQVIGHVATSGLAAMAWSPDGKWLAIGTGGEGMILLEPQIASNGSHTNK